MIRVCGLEKLSSGKYLVSLEDGTELPLYGKELSAYGIREEGFLSEEDCRVIREELLQKRARMRSLHLLTAMDRTEAQLRQKLKEGHYPPEVIEDAVAYVKGYHYIDDVRYAGNYIEAHKAGRSQKRLRQELMQKGVADADIEEAFLGAEFPPEESQIRAWMQKKGIDPKSADRKERERMFRSLLQKGYHPSAIFRSMEPSGEDEGWE